MQPRRPELVRLAHGCETVKSHQRTPETPPPRLHLTRTGEQREGEEVKVKLLSVQPEHRLSSIFILSDYYY